MDDVIKFYFNNKLLEVVLMKFYEKFVEWFNEMVVEFLFYFFMVKSVGNLELELDKCCFVIFFRVMLRLRNEVKGYNEFDVEDFIIEE